MAVVHYLDKTTKQVQILRQLTAKPIQLRQNSKPVFIIEDRPFIDGPEVFVRRMIESGEMPKPHADLYYTILKQSLQNEHIRMPDLLVYLRSEPASLENRRRKRAEEGDGYAQTITGQYLKEIHDCYEDLVTNWKRVMLRYREMSIVPPDIDLLILPAEIDMYEHPDYVHVAAGTIREKVRRMIASRRNNG